MLHFLQKYATVAWCLEHFRVMIFSVFLLCAWKTFCNALSLNFLCFSATLRTWRIVLMSSTPPSGMQVRWWHSGHSMFSLPSSISRENAYSRTGGIFIRDTARHTAYSLWFNEVWPYASLNHNEYAVSRAVFRMKMPAVREYASSLFSEYIRHNKCEG